MTRDRDDWLDLDQSWDLVIIGGGITGAGVLFRAAQAGFKALLVEGRDFASGTSSRSGRMIHGGIRYLREHQFGVSRHSVQERERLLRDMPGLVNRAPISYLCMPSDHSPCWRLGADVLLYEAFARRLRSGWMGAQRTRAEEPLIGAEGLQGSYAYCEGLTDDSRLVLRVLADAVRLGATCRNYTRAVQLQRREDGTVVGVALEDVRPEHKGRTLEICSRVVVNATGYRADELRSQVGGARRIRMARGSHLNFQWERFPLRKGICYYHPRDQRIQFAMPWKGVVIAGTTDLDHDLENEAASGEPAITEVEVDYILEGLRHVFPEGQLSSRDVISTFSGVRPIISGGADSPSQESRRHAVWDEYGLITIAGGKLTTFRLMAEDVLKRVRRYLRPLDAPRPLQAPSIEGVVHDTPLKPSELAELAGRYGKDIEGLIADSNPAELEEIGHTGTYWAEIRWAARMEQVVHLDDLMLRRVRLGLLLPDGAAPQLEHIRSLVTPELGWGETRWLQEFEDYRQLWRSSYSLPAGTC